MNLCRNILVEARTSEPPAPLVRDAKEPKTDYERLTEAQKAGDIEFLVAFHLKNDPDADPAVVREINEHFCELAAKRKAKASVADEEKAACSFCEQAQTRDKKLIRGPGVAVCERCVDEANAALLADSGV